jgi:hypothetical protein
MSLTFSPLLSFFGDPICLYLFCGGEECLGSVAFPFAGDVDFTMVTEDSLNYDLSTNCSIMICRLIVQYTLERRSERSYCSKLFYNKTEVHILIAVNYFTEELTK